ncbi:hypothetical protein [Sphingomonas koreensis]
MARLFTLMLCALALLSIGTAPVAHAAERVICVEVSQPAYGADADHAKPGAPDTDNSDKNIAHQHGGCHGHHFASLTDAPLATELASREDVRVHGPASALAPAALDPALRPPQA